MQPERDRERLYRKKEGKASSGDDGAATRRCKIRSADIDVKSTSATNVDGLDTGTVSVIDGRVHSLRASTEKSIPRSPTSSRVCGLGA